MTDARLPGRNKPQTSSSGSYGGITGGSSSRSVARSESDPDSLPTLAAIRAARRRWATGVAVATTINPDEPGTFRGATISSFMHLSQEPPLVGISVESTSRLATLIPQSGIFAVSILDRAHEFQSDRFSGYGPQPDGKFTGIVHHFAVTGSPVLSGALAWFDCKVTEVVPTGDHLLIIGESVAIGVGPDTDDPLLNYEGAYRRIEGA